MKFNRRSTVSAATQTSLGERNKHRCTNPVRGLAAGHCQLEQSEGDFRRFASAIHQVACDV
jgi:hypothetical protein